MCFISLLRITSSFKHRHCYKSLWSPAPPLRFFNFWICSTRRSDIFSLAINNVFKQSRRPNVFRYRHNIDQRQPRWSDILSYEPIEYGYCSTRRPTFEHDYEFRYKPIWYCICVSAAHFADFATVNRFQFGIDFGHEYRHKHLKLSFTFGDWERCCWDE